MKIDSKYKIEKVTANHATRFVLQHIRVEKKEDGYKAITTNGKSIAIVPVDCPEEKEGFIHRDDLIFYRKHPDTKVTKKIDVEVKDKEFSFVDYEKVFPEKEPVCSFNINPKLLIELAEALGSKENIKLEIFESETSNLPIRVSITNMSNGERGLIMPILSKES